MKISIVIPAKNEEKHVGKLIDKIEDLNLDSKNLKLEIIAVNDGSTDRTKDVILKKMRKYKNVKIVSYKKNRGKTYACVRGVKKAKGRWIIIMDADLQHDPQDIKKFIKSMKGADIIIGERPMNKIPIIRKISNIVAAKFINFFTERNFDDVLCGYRAIKKEKFNQLGLKDGRYEIEIDMILNAIKLGMSIKTIKVRSIYNKNGKKVGSRMPITSATELVFHSIKKVWRFKCTNKL